MRKYPVYLASLFGEKPQRMKDAEFLQEHGYKVVSGWVFGGEEGLTYAGIASVDVNDLRKAEAILSFTHPRGTPTPGGGRHVEHGIALALGLRLVVIGPPENVFHHYPGTEIYDTLEDFVNQRPSQKPLPVREA